jgi:hypothetical protein
MAEILSVLSEIERDLEKIQEVDVQRAQNQLNPPQANERSLGTLHNENLKRVWTLAGHYEYNGKLSALRMTMADAQEAAELGLAGQRAAEFCKVARNIFWLQVKEDIGPVCRQGEGGIALRTNWLIVETKATSKFEIIGAALADLGLKPPEPETE